MFLLPCSWYIPLLLPLFHVIPFCYISSFLLCCIMIFLVHLIMSLGDYPWLHLKCLFIGLCNLWPLIRSLCKFSVPDITHQTMMCLGIVCTCGIYTPGPLKWTWYSSHMKEVTMFYFFTSLGEWWQGLLFFTALRGLSVRSMRSKYSCIDGYLACITIVFPLSLRQRFYDITT